MSIIFPTALVTADHPLPLLTSTEPIPPIRFRPRHTTLAERSRNFGIELVATGPGTCELCENPCGFPFAGFFGLEGGERVPVCDLCLLDESIFLGLLAAAAAVLRKVGCVASPMGRLAMAQELAPFAYLFDALLAQNFGPATEPSQLLEHLARLGRFRLERPARTH